MLSFYIISEDPFQKSVELVICLKLIVFFHNVCKAYAVSRPDNIVLTTSKQRYVSPNWISAIPHHLCKMMLLLSWLIDCSQNVTMTELQEVM